jgi:hypothetical protein
MGNWRSRLRAAIEERGGGASWKQLSKESGLGETFVRDIIDPRYEKDPSVANLLKLCARLGVSAASILDGTDPPYQRIPIGGRLSGEEWWPSNLGLSLEMRVDGEAVALEMENEGISGYHEGDIVIGVKRPASTAHLYLGRECIVMTEDGKRYFRYLQRATMRNRFTLRSHSPSIKDVENVKVAWVAPVAWVKRAKR